jgi:hypothetical protein
VTPLLDAAAAVLLRVPGGCEEERRAHSGAHLELAGVHAIVALNEGVAQVVDAELVEAIQGPIVKVQVVGVAARGRR